MLVLKDISVLWSLLHTLVMFGIFFTSRYSKRKTTILALSTMVPLLLANFVIYLVVGREHFLSVLLLTCTLPSLVFFWFLAKHRDGRFLFTFCLSDTIWLEVIYITNIIDYFLGNTYVFMFISRLLIFPLLELFFYRKLRSIYLDIQNTITR